MIGDRWGVTDDEVAMRYPCDDLMPEPRHQLWRGVTVHATPAQVWPWVTQIQLAPYSYDWIDNLGRQSPRELRGLPDPRPGEHFTMVAGRRKVGEVLGVEHDEHYTGRIDGVLISYVLRPHRRSTRLLMKLVTDKGRWYSVPVGLGDWVMARRQLLNLKECAESAPG